MCFAILLLLPFHYYPSTLIYYPPIPILPPLSFHPYPPLSFQPYLSTPLKRKNYISIRRRISSYYSNCILRPTNYSPIIILPPYIMPNRFPDARCLTGEEGFLLMTLRTRVTVISIQFTTPTQIRQIYIINRVKSPILAQRWYIISG